MHTSKPTRHFLRFNANPFNLIHLDIHSRSSLSLLSISSVLLEEYYKAVSSANLLTVEWEIHEGKSSMQTKKSTVLRAEFWGTPDKMYSVHESKPLTNTCCCRLSRYEINQPKSSLVTSKSLEFSHQNTMLYCIEGLCKIEEYSCCNLTIVNV